jgi:hypothetical protein
MLSAFGGLFCGVGASLHGIQLGILFGIFLATVDVAHDIPKVTHDALNFSITPHGCSSVFLTQVYRLYVCQGRKVHGTLYASNLRQDWCIIRTTRCRRIAQIPSFMLSISSDDFTCRAWKMRVYI